MVLNFEQYIKYVLISKSFFNLFDTKVKTLVIIKLIIYNLFLI